MRSSARRLPAALVAALALAALAASDVRIAGQQPTFRSGVEVIAIDVNVVDGKGKPVVGLRPDDFTVTVDKKARKIASVQYIDHGIRFAQVTQKGAAASPASVLDSLAGTRPTGAAGRNVMIVIDTDTLETGEGHLALKGARAFLDQLPAEDRVGVAQIPRVPSSLGFSTDRAEARKALSSIITMPQDLPSGQYQIGLQEAYDIEKHDSTVVARVTSRECKCNYEPGAMPAGAMGIVTGATTLSTGAPASNRTDPGGATTSSDQGAGNLAPCTDHQVQECVIPVLMEAHQLAIVAHMNAQRSLDALRDLGEALAQIPGPKTLVFVTGGIGVPETTTSFDPLEPALAKGQVTLYTLYLEHMSLGQVKTGLSPTWFDDDRIPVRGVENLTAAANGTLIQVQGKIEAAFDQIATEMSGSYLLGIEVEPGDRNGKPHGVQVKINRPGVQVRARRQYVIEPEKADLKRAEPVAPLGAADRALRRAERAAPTVQTIDSVTPELVSVLLRAGDFVLDYEPRIKVLASDEQYDQTLSKWKRGMAMVNGKVQEKEDWFLDKRRQMKSEYVLARSAGPMGWRHFRDSYEVDGSSIRPRTGRLSKLFADSPATAVEQAAEIMTASARYNLGFGEKNMDVPTLALVLLEPGNRGRFFFRKEGEMEIGGSHTWQIAFTEGGTPTIFTGEHDDSMPLEGKMWIQPDLGRVVRTIVRLNMEEADAEITVTYGPIAELGGLWVPVETQEVFVSDTQKVESIARYSNFRVVQPAAISK